MGTHDATRFAFIVEASTWTILVASAEDRLLARVSSDCTIGRSMAAFRGPVVEVKLRDVEACGLTIGAA